MSGSRLPIVLTCVIAGAPVLSATRAHGIDTLAVAPTYYEQVIGEGSLAELETPSGGLPASLHVLDAEGRVEYRTTRTDGDRVHWTVDLEMEERAHERVDTVYDLILALPLPEEFAAEQWGIPVREGSKSRSVPFVYGGEKVTLKRNIGLEKAWLPSLVGAAGSLPDLSGSGYVFTLWDAILRYDPGRGPHLQGIASFSFSTPLGVSAPNPADERLAGYLITWIPTLPSGVPPYTIRIDVRPPVEP